MSPSMPLPTLTGFCAVAWGGEGRAISSIPKIASVRFKKVPLVQLSGFGFVKLMLVCRLPAGDRCKSIIRLVRRVKTIGRTTVS